MNRILAFHYHEPVGNQVRMAPSAYYIEADYEKVAVRVYAEVVPVSDAEFDIFDDGVSIFNNRAAVHTSITGIVTRETAKTTVVLTKGQNSEEIADDFNNSIIEKGSWVSCDAIHGGGGRNFTVQLELSQVSEDEEPED